MRIIPAIDIIDGKCVRLTQGDYSTKKIYNEDPVAAALEFEAMGLRYLHVVDLDGARSGTIKNERVLQEISRQTSLQVDFGGGIKSEEDLQKALDAGAEQVTCGSIAVKHPELVLRWLEKFGRDKIILGADVSEGYIAVSGWQEKTTLAIEDLLHMYIDDGMKYVICTDISSDGMLKGPNFELYSGLLETFPGLHLIASGGVSSTDDLKRLQDLGIEGVIIGKALYEGSIDLEELKLFQNA